MADLVSYALTTVADVKESLGILSGDTSKDNLIIRKINQVTESIMNYCQRNFVLQEYIETYKASHIDEIVLKQRPLIVDDNHIFTAEWRTTAFNDDEHWETIDSQLFFLDKSSGVLELMYNSQGYWQRYRYTYWAGYATSQTDLDNGIAGLPNDLVEAANMLTCYFVNNPNGSTAGVQQVKEGQRETRFFQKNSFYNVLQQLGIDETLDNYADETVLTDR